MAPVPEWLNYGALGLLTLTLFGGFMLARMVLKRLDEASRFTETLAQNVIAAMQEIVRDSTATQKEVAGTLRQLTKELEGSRADHTRLINNQKEILRGLRGGLGRNVDGG